MPAAKQPTKPITCLTPRLCSQSENRHKRINRRRLLCSREYKRLHAMVPAIATKTKVSKITVIEETIKYIDELHTALWLRFQTKGLPQALRGLINIEDMQHLSRSQLCELLQNVVPNKQQSNSIHQTPSTTQVRQRNRRTGLFKSKKLKKNC